MRNVAQGHYLSRVSVNWCMSLILIKLSTLHTSQRGLKADSFSLPHAAVWCCTTAAVSVVSVQTIIVCMFSVQPLNVIFQTQMKLWVSAASIAAFWSGAYYFYSPHLLKQHHSGTMFCRSDFSLGSSSCFPVWFLLPLYYVKLWFDGLKTR